MTAASRRLRDAAALLVVGGLVAGSLFWGDNAWPFAPFRMFAKGTEHAVWALALDADYADGHAGKADFEAFHLRRAELEGQVTRIEAHPEILGDLIESYNRTVPPGRRIVRLRVVSRWAPVHNGRPIPAHRSSTDRRRTGPPPIVWHHKVVAQWPPPPPPAPDEAIG